MEFYEKSPLRGLSNFLVICQFGFTVLLIVKGAFTAYFGGAGIFDSIFFGGLYANLMWVAVPSTLFAMYWLWPRILVDIVNIVVMPITIMLMFSLGWQLSGHVGEVPVIYRDDYADIYVSQLEDTYNKYLQGDEDAKIEVNRYESANNRSFSELIAEAKVASVKEQNRQKENRDKANWGVRILSDMLN